MYPAQIRPHAEPLQDEVSKGCNGKEEVGTYALRIARMLKLVLALKPWKMENVGSRPRAAKRTNSNTKFA